MEKEIQLLDLRLQKLERYLLQKSAADDKYLLSMYTEVQSNLENLKNSNRSSRDLFRKRISYSCRL